MKNIVKQTREVGTSAGVLLPRSWLNKQVVVTLFFPPLEKMAQDVFEILFKYNLNEDIKGVYLFGSYSREDFDFNSDIDILILTEKTNKLINQNNYEILLISEDSFTKNLPNNLNYLSLLSEIKIIFNKGLIEKYKQKKYKFDNKKLLLEIEKILDINKDTIKTCEENSLKVPDGVVYSIILRLKELFLIKCVLSEKSYHKKDFLKFVDEKIYSAYLRIKRNEKELNNIFPKELVNVINLSEKWLKELKE